MSNIKILKAVQSDPSKMEDLIQALKNETRLDLSSYNEEVDPQWKFLIAVTMEDKINLAKALETNHSVTELNLDLGVHNKSERNRDPLAKALAEVLNKNATLTSLSLENNDIGPQGIQAIADALTKNTSLTSLSLSFNTLKKGAIKILSEALKINKGLTSLSLRDTDIRDVGAEQLAKVLEGNTTLTELVLDTNRIGEEGLKALAEALKNNTTLRKLDLRFNPCMNEEGDAKKRVLETLALINTQLEWNNINFQKERSNAIRDALESPGGPLLPELTNLVIEYDLENFNLKSNPKPPTLLETPEPSSTSTKRYTAPITIREPIPIKVGPIKEPNIEEPKLSLLSKLKQWIKTIWDSICNFVKKGRAFFSPNDLSNNLEKQSKPPPEPTLPASLPPNPPKTGNKNSHLPGQSNPNPAKKHLRTKK